MANSIDGELARSLPSLKIDAAPVLVREQALDTLRGAIINGRFPPGTRLIERELCEAMGISRTSIREVLRRLESERLIKVEPRKGPTVARVTRSQAQEIYDIRAYLESVQLQRFIDLASDGDIKQLKAIYKRFATAARSADISLSVKLMAEFYNLISAVAKTEVVNDILSQLTARVSYLRATSMSQPGRIEKSVEEIGAIVDAVVERDYNAAQSATVRHVKNAAATALARLPD